MSAHSIAYKVHCAFDSYEDECLEMCEIAEQRKKSKHIIRFLRNEYNRAGTMCNGLYRINYDSIKFNFTAKDSSDKNLALCHVLAIIDKYPEEIREKKLYKKLKKWTCNFDYSTYTTCKIIYTARHLNTHQRTAYDEYLNFITKHNMAIPTFLKKYKEEEEKIKQHIKDRSYYDAYTEMHKKYKELEESYNKVMTTTKSASK